MEGADLQLATEVAGRYFGRPAESVVPIVGLGSVNLVFVAASAGQEIVVRVSTAADASRGEAFFQKERWCIEQAARAGVPGPEVLDVGVWRERPFMLQTLLPGGNGETLPSAEIHVWHELGCYARLTHSVRVDGFGETLDRFLYGESNADWRIFAEYNRSSLTEGDELLTLNVYTREQRPGLQQLFHEMRETEYKFGLAHGDLSLRNTIVDESGKVSLLDWGSAEAHIVPHYDLVHILCHHAPDSLVVQAFLSGYGMDATEFARLLPQIQALALMKALDLTRWAIDRCPERIEELAENAAEEVKDWFGA